MGASFEERCQAIRESRTARDAAWRAGQLWWLLHAIQWQMYRQFYSSTEDQVWNCARRLGKTRALVVIHFETNLRIPRARTALGASQAVDVEDVVEPMVDEILETCPRDLLPRTWWAKHRIVWPNKSVMKIAGCDNQNYKHLRGRGLHLWSIDEAAFVAELTKVVDDVLAPQTWTTNGRGIQASSPPDTPGHPFQTYYFAAKANGNSARFVFEDNPMLSPERREEILLKEARKKRMTVEQFKQTTVYRREFQAEFVVEETRAVLPEFTESLAASLTVPQLATPLFTDWYTIIDCGYSRDPTAITVGYWDFARKKFRVQRDRVLYRPTTEAIAAAVQELEWLTFGLVPSERAPFQPPPGATWAKMPPLQGKHFRIMDDSTGMVRRDLAIKYALPTIAPEKDEKDAGLMDLRDGLVREEVEFEPGSSESPGCNETVAQCQAAIWNKQHTEYERVEGFGHFDLVDNLLYGWRNVIKNKGRVPPRYGVDVQNTAYRAPPRQESQPTSVLRGVFGR